MDNNLDWWCQGSPLRRLTTRRPLIRLHTGALLETFQWLFYPLLLLFVLSLSLLSPSRTSYPLCEFLPPPLCSLLLPGSFEAERDADRITLGPCFHSLLWLAININGDVSGWRKKETSCWEAWMTSVYETAPSYRESATTVRLSCRTKIHGAFRWLGTSRLSSLATWKGTDHVCTKLDVQCRGKFRGNSSQWELTIRLVRVALLQGRMSGQYPPDERDILFLYSSFSCSSLSFYYFALFLADNINLDFYRIQNK